VLAYCSLHHRIIRLVYVVCATCALVGMAKSTIRTAGWAEKIRYIRQVNGQDWVSWFMVWWASLAPS
jgi:hypothetical protein